MSGRDWAQRPYSANCLQFFWLCYLEQITARVKCYKHCFMPCHISFSLNSTHLLQLSVHLWSSPAICHCFWRLCFWWLVFDSWHLESGSSLEDLLLPEFYQKFEFNFNVTALWRYSMIYELPLCYWWTAALHLMCLLQLLQPWRLGTRLFGFMQYSCPWIPSKCWRWSVQTAGECWGKRTQ